MGNFEKLGILVIIVLVVTILVLTFWGMNIPIADDPPAVTELSGRLPGEDPGLPPVVPVDEEREPGPWPLPPVKPVVEPTPPDPAPPDPVPPPAGVRHVVKKGESLYGIAVRYLEDGNLWKEIQAANPGVTPENLRPGQTLTIPSPDRLPDRGPEPVRPVRDGLRTYQVKKGDSLSAIARRELGTETRWREIHRLNEDLIGPDASRVQAGMTLVLPR